MTHPNSKAVPRDGIVPPAPEQGSLSGTDTEPPDRIAELPPQPATGSLPDVSGMHVQIRDRIPDRRVPPVPTPTEVRAVRVDEIRLPSELPPSSEPALVPSLFPEGERDTDISRPTNYDDPIETEVRRDRVILLRMDGADAGEVFSLEQEALRIGRHPMAELSVRDDGVSRIHARIYREGTLWFVEDQGSTNGTFVQGERVQQSVLRDGDSLQFGPRVTFRYSLVDSRQETVLRDLYESSRFDALTAAFNRKHFEERLEMEIVAAERRQAPLSLITFDLDHFKQVNDTFGHPAGDAVLQHVASLVKQRLRTSDLLARVGGEEFAVLLPVAELRAAARVGERMRVSVATKPAFYAGQHIPVSISVGCASLACCQKPSATALVATADRRLYAAKNGGRNRVVSSG